MNRLHQIFIDQLDNDELTLAYYILFEDGEMHQQWSMKLFTNSLENEFKNYVMLPDRLNGLPVFTQYDLYIV